MRGADLLGISCGTDDCHLIIGCDKHSNFKQLTLLVTYVKNNAFPQPLKEDEEQFYLVRMAEGNLEYNA
jgi:hypothetical protein